MNATTSKSGNRKGSTKKTAAPRKAPPKKAAPKKVVANSKTTNSPVRISAEERWRMIAVAAYHRAEKRGFSGGHEVEDWLAAEKEISTILRSS